MTHLREKVALSGYGQRDPLIEYKQEAFQMFRKLLDSIQHNVINTLFKIQINIELPPERQDRPVQPKNLQTNEEAIEGNLSGPKFRQVSAQSAVAQKIAGGSPASKTPEAGRNDPCPCGSGKKYKKCHGA